MQRTELVSILKASFEAGLLVDESGNVLFGNKAAQELFGIHLDSPTNLGIDQQVVFLHNKTRVSWNEIQHVSTETISVICTSGDGRRFSSIAKLALLGTFALVYIRRDEVDETMSLASSMAERALEQEQNLVAGIVDAALDPLFQINEKGVIKMVNKATTTQFGWTREEFIGSNISMIVGGEHAARHDQYLERYLRTGEARVMGTRRELPARRKDGSEFIIQLSLVEVDTNDDERMFCGFVLDLTDQKQQAARVEQKTNLITGVLDAALDPLLQINEKGIIKMVNKAATTQFGWTREEFIGSNINMIVGAEHAARHDQYLERYLRTGEARVMGSKRELPARRKDGTEFIIQLSLVEVDVADGEERMFCGFILDLTEQKRQAARLVRETNLVAGVIDAALDPLLQINEKGIIKMVNYAATAQFGWTREEFIGSNISMIVGAEHAARHDQYLERYLRTGEAHVMGSKRELPARRKDGSEFIIQLSLVEVDVADGEERMFCGFILDLTEQKRHLSEVQQRESFTNKVIEGSYDALLVTNKEGKINRVNAAAVRQFELSREELCHKSAFSLFDPFDAAWLKDKMDKFLATGTAIVAEMEVEAVRPSSDTRFPASVSVSDLDGPDGEPCFAIYLHDLTERKRMLHIEAEKNAAEYLLFNMLPVEIAGQLKDDPSHIAESHNFSAVLFADIVGFTAMSSTMEPCAVVSMLNDLFSMFDEVVEKYGLNKVKTIGDCYMVTSVPAIEVDDEVEHCRLMCHFGLDMIATLQRYNSKGPDRKLDLRVGINCGPVVAGVVGTKRFLYDLWGDAVNLASRMESTGIPGRIQTTSHVADLMKDHFTFEKRGMVHVKGKGEMETYFLIDCKKQYRPMLTSAGRRMSRMSIWSPAGRPSLLNLSLDTDLVNSFRDLGTAPEKARSNES